MAASFDMRPEIRIVAPSELAAAYQVLSELRAGLDFPTFESRLSRQELAGYELYGAFLDRLVGVIGFRPVETMARGPHLHVDDLVVTAELRGQGVGSALLEFAEGTARARLLSAVFLDSRSEVIGFYERLGYATHTATLMRKRLQSSDAEPSAAPDRGRKAGPGR